MACIINAESGTGLTNSADGSGILKLQSAGKTTNALAWVNFNGTGTVAIRSSYNVSSITDNGTGDYTVNFATALSDANYALTGCCGGAFAGQYALNPRVLNTTSAQIETKYRSDANTDLTNVNVAIFGN